MKQALLEIIKQAIEIDLDKSPNIVFLRHLKRHLGKQFEGNMGRQSVLERTEARNMTRSVIGNIDINFSALGMKCNEEDNEYLSELAHHTATFVWKVYELRREFGYGAFINIIKNFSLSLT